MLQEVFLAFRPGDFDEKKELMEALDERYNRFN
jgi:hypothetical protein